MQDYITGEEIKWERFDVINFQRVRDECLSSDDNFDIECRMLAL